LKDTNYLPYTIFGKRQLVRPVVGYAGIGKEGVYENYEISPRVLKPIPNFLKNKI